MTRKYFIAIADVLRRSIPDEAVREKVAEELAQVLRNTNDRFDAVRFIDYATNGG